MAQNAENCDLFYGLVVDNALIGRASVSFSSANGCACKGMAQVTHCPGVLYLGNCVGQKGYVKAHCSDGRSFKGNFTTTSLTTGFGTATDSLGNQYQFTFGHTVQEAIEKVNELRKKLGCPEITVSSVELKVHGQVMKPR